jgi:hypothetical protein
MVEFLKFKKMVTPIIIQVLFRIGVAVSVIVALVAIVRGVSGDGALVLWGFLLLLLGPLACRVCCEILIVVFSINDTLTEIKDEMKNRSL